MKITVSLDEKDLDAVADAIADRVIAQVKESLGSAAKDEGAKKAAPVKEATEPKKPASKKAAPKTPAPKDEPEEGTEEAAEQVVVTRDDVLAKLREFRDKHGMNKATDVIGKFAGKFSEVKEEDYAALVEALDEADSAGAEADEEDPFA